MAMTTDEIVAKLKRRALPLLKPTSPWDPDLVSAITALGNHEHEFVVAALHLANDDLDRCHAIAQRNEGDPTADLLHATLHRREGDYWNSKYWYARTTHPLAKRDAAAFVDACEATEGKGEEDEGLLARQWDEIMEIVAWTRANCVSEALVDV